MFIQGKVPQVHRNARRFMGYRQYKVASDTQPLDICGYTQSGSRVHLFETQLPSLGVKVRRKIMEKERENECMHVILIVGDDVRIKSTYIEEPDDDDRKFLFECFHRLDFMYCPFDNKFVDPQRVLTEAEAACPLKISPRKHHPKIHVGDVICKWLGARIDDFIEITKISETGGTFLKYRVVIA